MHCARNLCDNRSKRCGVGKCSGGSKLVYRNVDGSLLGIDFSAIQLFFSGITGHSPPITVVVCHHAKYGQAWSGQRRKWVEDGGEIARLRAQGVWKAKPSGLNVPMGACVTCGLVGCGVVGVGCRGSPLNWYPSKLLVPSLRTAPLKSQY